MKLKKIMKHLTSETIMNKIDDVFFLELGRILFLKKLSEIFKLGRKFYFQK